MKAFYPGFTFVYGDAEFTPNLHTPGGLVSLALHSERGSVYAVNAEADRDAFCASPFRRTHIWSKLPLRKDGSLDLKHPAVMSYSDIADMVAVHFDTLTGGRKYRKHVGFIANHGTQDMGRIHAMFDDDWFDVMPPSVPRRPFADLATLEDLAGVEDDHLPNGLRLPELPADEAHHALRDAKWDREVHEFLMQHSQAVRIASGVERLES
jgi:hypothetical protein